MSIIKKMIDGVEIPDFYPVRQTYPEDGITDVPSSVMAALDGSGIAESLTPGEVAISVGSRGVANIPEIARAAVSWFRAKGLSPFIVPCMGSHGGATAEGQVKVLKDLGVTEDSAGCPIRSSMEVVLLGRLDNGLPVYMDAMAWDAPNVFVINRVKPHTSFSGRNESGLVKMLTIGLGKQKGADAAHTFGNDCFGAIMPAMARMCLAQKPGIVGGLALVENERDQTCLVAAVPARELEERDAKLLTYAKSRMPSLPFEAIDLLIVDRIGKNISGAGMDPNVTGRRPSGKKPGDPDISRLVVLGLTPQSKGNASGIGMADIIPQSLADQIDFAYMYANLITSNNLPYARLPMTLATEEDVIRCGIKTCLGRPGAQRVVRIRDTLSVDTLLVSRAAADTLEGNEKCTVSVAPVSLQFDAAGSLDATVWKTVFK